MVVARCWQQWITVYRRGGHPVPSRETIRRRLTEVGLKPTSAKTLTTDPTSRQCRLDFCRPSLECDRLETCHLQ
ncbi:hypothetical protein TNCV_1388321 [Trichonephila clavipes]|nr:hypothetical protein TNCV_1388321 [Trichonephila clavipes]